MKKLLVVCLGVLVSCSLAVGAVDGAESFSLADRVGEPNERCFYLFSTSAGNYTVRQDGMGEFTSPKGMRRVFSLKVGGKGRINSIYFAEHEGDLFVFYQIHDATSEWAYLVRMEQTQRKVRWIASVATGSEAPAIDGDVITVNAERFSKVNGQLRPTSPATSRTRPGL
jgi:hypothetical protein